MRTLVYKRTHVGDPDDRGWFGCCDCMGGVRGHRFDAAIGIGGIGDEPQQHDIDGKVTWIGVGAHRFTVPGLRGPVVTFDHFIRWDADGPDFCTLAPWLSAKMYDGEIRLLKTFTPPEQAEVDRLLELASDAPPSVAFGPVPVPKTRRTCRRSTC